MMLSLLTWQNCLALLVLFLACCGLAILWRLDRRQLAEAQIGVLGTAIHDARIYPPPRLHNREATVVENYGKALVHATAVHESLKQRARYLATCAAEGVTPRVGASWGKLLRIASKVTKQLEAGNMIAIGMRLRRPPLFDSPWSDAYAIDSEIPIAQVSAPPMQ